MESLFGWLLYEGSPEPLQIFSDLSLRSVVRAGIQSSVLVLLGEGKSNFRSLLVCSTESFRNVSVAVAQVVHSVVEQDQQSIVIVMLLCVRLLEHQMSAGGSSSGYR